MGRIRASTMTCAGRRAGALPGASALLAAALLSLCCVVSPVSAANGCKYQKVDTLTCDTQLANDRYAIDEASQCRLGAINLGLATDMQPVIEVNSDSGVASPKGCFVVDDGRLMFNIGKTHFGPCGGKIVCVCFDIKCLDPTPAPATPLPATAAPTSVPTSVPTPAPTAIPTSVPTPAPTAVPPTPAPPTPVPVPTTAAPPTPKPLEREAELVWLFEDPVQPDQLSAGVVYTFSITDGGEVNATYWGDAFDGPLGSGRERRASDLVSVRSTNTEMARGVVWAVKNDKLFVTYLTFDVDPDGQRRVMLRLQAADGYRPDMSESVTVTVPTAAFASYTLIDRDTLSAQATYLRKKQGVVEDTMVDALSAIPSGQQVALLLDLECGTDGTRDDLPWIMHPINIKIKGHFCLGAVVCNMCLCIGVWFFQFLLTKLALSLHWTPVRVINTAEGLVRFPGFSFFIFTFFYQGMSKCVWVLIFEAFEQLEAIESVVGGMGVVFLMLVPGHLLYVLRRVPVDKSARYAPVYPSTGSVAEWAVGKGEWVSARRTNPVTFKYSMQLRPFTAACSHFIVYDYAIMMAVGFGSALPAKSYAACGVIRLCLCLLCIAFTIFEWLMRPHVRSRDNHCDVVRLGLQSFGLFFASIGFFLKDVTHPTITVAGICFLLALFILALKLIADCATELYVFHKKRRTTAQRREWENNDEADAATLLEKTGGGGAGGNSTNKSTDTLLTTKQLTVATTQPYTEHEAVQAVRRLQDAASDANHGDDVSPVDFSGDLRLPQSHTELRRLVRVAEASEYSTEEALARLREINKGLTEAGAGPVTVASARAADDGDKFPWDDAVLRRYIAAVLSPLGRLYTEDEAVEALRRIAEEKPAVDADALRSGEADPCLPVHDDGLLEAYMERAAAAAAADGRGSPLLAVSVAKLSPPASGGGPPMSGWEAARRVRELVAASGPAMPASLRRQFGGGEGEDGSSTPPPPPAAASGDEGEAARSPKRKKKVSFACNDDDLAWLRACDPRMPRDDGELRRAVELAAQSSAGGYASEREALASVKAIMRDNVEWSYQSVQRDDPRLPRNHADIMRLLKIAEADGDIYTDDKALHVVKRIIREDMAKAKPRAPGTWTCAELGAADICLPRDELQQLLAVAQEQVQRESAAAAAAAAAASFSSSSPSPSPTSAPHRRGSRAPSGVGSSRDPRRQSSVASTAASRRGSSVLRGSLSAPLLQGGGGGGGSGDERTPETTPSVHSSALTERSLAAAAAGRGGSPPSGPAPLSLPAVASTASLHSPTSFSAASFSSPTPSPAGATRGGGRRPPRLASFTSQQNGGAIAPPSRRSSPKSPLKGGGGGGGVQPVGADASATAARGGGGGGGNAVCGFEVESERNSRKARWIGVLEDPSGTPLSTLTGVRVSSFASASPPDASPTSGTGAGRGTLNV